MNIRYNEKKLQKITEDFSNITGLDIVVVDSEYREIASCYKGCNFCQIIQNNGEGEMRCACSDMELLTRCRENNKLETHICHAGLTDMAVPIQKNNLVLGYILFGRIRNTENFSDIYNRVSWISCNYEKLDREFRKLKYFNETQIESIANVATAITAYILSEGMLNEEYNSMTSKIIACIDDKLTLDLSVDFLCRELNISKNTLYEHFHSSFHCTVNEYISQKRFEKAKQLLIETDFSLADITELSGIRNYTYFFKLMKKYEGITPRQYRQKYSQRPQNKKYWLLTNQDKQIR